jgi:hypothetical protein
MVAFDSVLSGSFVYFSGPQGAIRLPSSNRMGIDAVCHIPGMKQVSLTVYEKRVREVRKQLKNQEKLIKIRTIREAQRILQLAGDHLLSLQFLQPVRCGHLLGERFQQGGIQPCRSSTVGLKESDRGAEVSFGAAFEVVWAQGAGGRMLP